MRARVARWRIVTAAAVLALLVLPSLWAEMRAAEPRAPTAPALPEGAARYRVFVADWGYHTAIILEQPRGWALGPPGEEHAQFVEFAWGDRRYYMESNHWPHSVFATLMLPTAAVTYIDGRPAPPARGFRSLHVRDVSGAELRALAAELEAWVVSDAAGSRTGPYPAPPGHAGRFYPGTGSYLWWMNCNRWTVDRLAAAGLATGGRGVLFSGEVPGRLLGFERVRP